MDILFMFIGVLRLAEEIDLFTGSDFPMFMGFAKREDYDLKEVSQVEKWILLMGATRGFGAGLNRLPDGVGTILLAVFGATLAAHVYVSKSEKFRKER